MTLIRYEDVDEYVAARDKVVRAAEAIVKTWEDGKLGVEPTRMLPAARELYLSVRALRSLSADRGVRDPSPPGQQEPDAEQVHGEAVHPGGQP